GAEVDTKVELGWLLDRNVGWFRSAQNLVDEIASAAVEAREVGPIGHETARLQPFAVGVHFGQTRRQREAIDANLVCTGKRLTYHIQGLRAILERLEGRCDICHLPDL